MSRFVHLHAHTTYSLLDGASSISGTIEKALADNMPGIAITDHGNMFGAFEFVTKVNKAGLKPIVGCEFYITDDRHKKHFRRAEGEKDNRRHQLLLAKNKTGYHNLAKLTSIGYIEGMYGKYPRIDKEVLAKYSEGVIATSCCLAATIPSMILQGDIEGAEKELQWWIEVFGEDYYIELMRHSNLDDVDGTGMSQEDVNRVLIGFAKKYNLKIIATNDSHYLEEKDAKPHDVLLAINTGSIVEDTSRFRFPSNDFYFKTTEEMQTLFHDLPQAIENTLEIFEKVEPISLTRDILMPHFAVPPQFKSQSEYLRHLTFQGAKVKYGELSEQVRERLEHELRIIEEMGFPGYFLIVRDFINAARELGVWVGPGRGSAAGSAVAYALDITDVDPIRYRLLFERFLNPERVTMPDMDIDFDDEGRQKVIDYVVQKYGRTHVAQIITFGTMAAKLAIRDTARVLDLPLNDADRLAKLVPTKPNTKLKTILFEDLTELSKNLPSDDIANIKKLREIYEGDTKESEVLKMATSIEGAVRTTGVHAAGVIIAPDDIREYIPVKTAKDSDLFVTQYDGKYVEDAGLLKMDFLGLKTLSILRDTIDNIVARHGEDHRIDLKKIPFDDEKTYQETFQQARTIGIFQFESDGMRKYMRMMKPNELEDLIALAALYRPGPMDNIPTYVRRKHGQEPVSYPHPLLEDILKPTYGIMVYQEQIMQAAQIIAGYSLGQADILRRAMGKKKKEEMARQRKTFLEGAARKGIPEDQATAIFEVMEKFASYGFNRSHAACYAILAYQTGYLKTHYPAEFMAAVMTHSKSDLSKLRVFLDECRNLGIEVLGPDLNQSQVNFTVTEEGKIRFGFSALKGVGEGPAEAIVRERMKNGPFTSPYDVVRRLPLQMLNKRVIESLVYGGAFDFYPQIKREQYFAPSGKYASFIEHLLKYGAACHQQNKMSTPTLFGDSSDMLIPEPEVPDAEAWSNTQKLLLEKEVAGLYLSGHPLDVYHVEIKTFANATIAQLLKSQKQVLRVAAYVTEARHRETKRGDGFGIFTVEDYTDTLTFMLFRDDYKKYKHLLEVNAGVLLEGAMQIDAYRNETVFKPINISSLGGLLEEKTRDISLYLHATDLTKELATNLEQVFKNHRGKQQVYFVVREDQNSVQLRFLSKKYKVSISPELIEAVKALNVPFKLSK